MQERQWGLANGPFGTALAAMHKYLSDCQRDMDVLNIHDFNQCHIIWQPMPD